MTSGYQMDLCVAAEETNQMVTSEMEAVEALAALARCSAVRGGGDASGFDSSCRELVKESTAGSATSRSLQDHTIAVSHGNASSMVTSGLDTGETVRNVPRKIFSRSYQSNSGSKLKQTLTEAEKEARRLHRVLANRESARQTIRRRQAMLLELSRKAADLSEENGNLKKEKELAVKEYNSLKGRNEFLKLQMTKVNKAEPREMQETQKSSQPAIATSAPTSFPNFLYNQPSLSPFFWPFIPSSNVIQLQYASHSDVMSSSQPSLQQRDMISSSHPGQEVSLGITGPGNPLVVVPVPWLFPFPSYSTTLHSHADTNKRQNETLSTYQCSMSSSSETLFVDDNHEFSSSLNMQKQAPSCRSVSLGSATGTAFPYSVDSGDHYSGHHLKVRLLVPETLSCIRPVESMISRPTTSSQEDGIYKFNAISASEHISQSLLRKNPKPVISHRTKSENVFAATIARRRRKELMKLKNIQGHHVCSHSASSWESSRTGTVLN